MKKLTYEEFGNLMHQTIKSQYRESWRMGQALFNTTLVWYPEIAERLRATGADCFHNDNKIIHFIDAILEK